jgi:hypothetical protein
MSIATTIEATCVQTIDTAYFNSNYSTYFSAFFTPNKSAFNESYTATQLSTIETS